MSHPLSVYETAYNISKVFNFVVKASRLTQLVAKVAWPLKHIAQLLGTHTCTLPHISIHLQYIANEIYVIVCLATRSSSRTSTWTRTTFSGEGLPYYLHIYYIYTHIHFFVFSVCERKREREGDREREGCVATFY